MFGHCNNCNSPGDLMDSDLCFVCERKLLNIYCERNRVDE
jgi:hypothetical protein